MAALGDLSTSIQNQERRWQLLPKHHLTVWGGHLRNPKTWVKKCVYSEKFIMLLIFEKLHIYMYICVNICAHAHTYSVHAMRQNHSEFSVRDTQVWPCLKQMGSTQAVNPGSSVQWQDLCLNCSLHGFDQMALMWFELWKSSQSLESLLLHSPATWNHWVENASSSNPLTLTTFRAISANNFLRHSFSL